jgi:hypothetical protein
LKAGLAPKTILIWKIESKLVVVVSLVKRKVSISNWWRSIEPNTKRSNGYRASTSAWKGILRCFTAVMSALKRSLE